MKTMNETHKKWGLMAVLVLALGFSLSAPMKQQLEMLDLASSDLDPAKLPKEMTHTEKIVDSKGNVIDVTYVQYGEKETLAFYPVSLEGRSCSSGNCMAHAPLNVPFSRDGKELEAALRKHIAKTAVRPAKTLKSDETEEETRDEEKKRLASEALDRAGDRCEKQRTETSKLTCLKSAFLRAAKLRKSALEHDAGRAFFNDRIKPILKKMGNKLSMDDTSYQDFATLLRDLEAELPGEYKDIRTDLVNMAKDVMKNYANQQRKARVNLMTMDAQAELYKREADRIRRTDPGTAMMYDQMAMEQKAQAMQLMPQVMAQGQFLQGTILPTLLSELNGGLNDALSNSLVDRSYVTSQFSALNLARTQAMALANQKINQNELLIIPLNGLGATATMPTTLGNPTVNPLNPLNPAQPTIRGAVVVQPNAANTRGATRVNATSLGARQFNQYLTQ